ncbi:MAG: hypothetical protein JXA06_04045 [Bacteroidetes bacterium]|nr:hypothetical protein [Bacteroidota bacterium]
MKTKTSHTIVQQNRSDIFTGLIKVLLTAIIFILSAGCGEDNSVQTVTSEPFSYTAYNTSGVPIVNGWMTIYIQDSSKVTGEWHFSKIGDPEDIGPCIGEGNLVGSVNIEHLHINLNPKYKDNNVFLIGNIQADKFEGEWVWGGFAGIINTGSFIAVRQ